MRFPALRRRGKKIYPVILAGLKPTAHKYAFSGSREMTFFVGHSVYKQLSQYFSPMTKFFSENLSGLSTETNATCNLWTRVNVECKLRLM